MSKSGKKSSKVKQVAVTLILVSALGFLLGQFGKLRMKVLPLFSYSLFITLFYFSWGALVFLHIII